MEEHGASQRVAGLALVEPSVAALTQHRIGQPLQGEQGPFDAPERAERSRQGISAPGRR